MAGQTDPDAFDHANDSLKAIGEKLDAMGVKMDGGVGGASFQEPVAITAGSVLPSNKNMCRQWKSAGLYYVLYIKSGEEWYVLSSDDIQGKSSTCISSYSYKCICF